MNPRISKSGHVLLCALLCLGLAAGCAPGQPAPASDAPSPGGLTTGTASDAPSPSGLTTGTASLPSSEESLSPPGQNSTRSQSVGTIPTKAPTPNPGKPNQGTPNPGTTNQGTSNPAEKVTVKNGWSYSGVKANNRNVALPKSTKQYSGEIVLSNLKEFLPDGEAGLDIKNLLLTLQGLANRSQPSLYFQTEGRYSGAISPGWIEDINPELFWLSYLTAPGQYLEKASIKTWSSSSTQAICQELLKKFKSCYNGLVVWDPKVYATSLAAMTAAGVDNLLPVRYDPSEGSLYTLLKTTMQIPVKLDLTGKFTGRKGENIWNTSLPSTGSAKNDAYLWAKVNYLDAGKTSLDYMGHFADSYPGPNGRVESMDNSMLFTVDFLVQQKAFVFDLCEYTTVLPYDDSNQALGTDYSTYNKILESQYKRTGGKGFGVVGWHTWKTMAGKGGSNYSGTTVEFRQNRLLASYNAWVVPGMRGANASVYSHVPEMPAYKQKASKTVDLSRYDPDTTYLMIYNGDYDGIEALEFYLPNLWDDEARGQLPLVWNINGANEGSSRMFFNYMYQTATANDYFVMGPNGVAYLDPEPLEPAKKDAKYARKIVPDGVEQYRDYTIGLSRKYDLDAAPRLIFSTGGVWNDRLLKTFADIAPVGLSYWNYEVAPRIRLIENSAGKSVPMVKMVTQITHLSSENEIYESLKDCLTNPKYADLKGMISYEMIHVDPGTILQAVNRIKAEGLKMEVVGPYEFFAYACKRA